MAATYTTAPESINLPGQASVHLHSMVEIPVFHGEKKKCNGFVEEPGCDLFNVLKCHGTCGLWPFKKS